MRVLQCEERTKSKKPSDSYTIKACIFFSPIVFTSQIRVHPVDSLQEHKLVLTLRFVWLEWCLFEHRTDRLVLVFSSYLSPAASMTLILGLYGSINLELGPNCSRLIQTNPIFVQSIKVMSRFSFLSLEF